MVNGLLQLTSESKSKKKSERILYNESILGKPGFTSISTAVGTNPNHPIRHLGKTHLLTFIIAKKPDSFDVCKNSLQIQKGFFCLFSKPNQCVGVPGSGQMHHDCNGSAPRITVLALQQWL